MSTCKLRHQTVALYLIAGSFFCLVFMSVLYLPNSSETCSCAKPNVKSSHDLVKTSGHKLAVIVPFRNRFEELQEFAPYMHRFLDNQNVDHEIFIINQMDDLRFNRASLINIGFLHIKKDPKFDYIVMHDVDLLPLNPELRYEYPGEGQALHIASPKLHPKYHYSTFVGGILILTVKDFSHINGLSNKYWGWGLEDDEFYLRMKQGGVTVIRPEHVTTGVNGTFRHVHGMKRSRDKAKCFDQKIATRKRDRVTGLHDVVYRLHSTSNVSFNSTTPVTILNVFLSCNRTFTPWCQCPPA